MIFFEEPKLARWDEETKSWRTDGFEKFKLDAEEGVFSFSTTHFDPYTLMQVRMMVWHSLFVVLIDQTVFWWFKTLILKTIGNRKGDCA